MVVGVLYVGVGARGEGPEAAGEVCAAAALWLHLLRSRQGGPVAPVRFAAVDVGVLAAGRLNVTATGQATYAAGVRLVEETGAGVLLAPDGAYGDELAPWAARAGVEKQVPVFATGAAADETYLCPEFCTSPEDCDAMRWGCKGAATRRFEYLFGTLTPATAYFRSFVSLARLQGAQLAVIISEDTPLSRSIARGAKGDLKTMGITLGAEFVVDSSGNEVQDAESAAQMATGAKAEPLSAKLTGSSFRSVTAIITDYLKAHDIDIVIAGTGKENCLAVIETFREKGYGPKGLGITGCVGTPEAYSMFKKDIRWISGPSQWDYRLKGQAYEEDTGGLFASAFDSSPKQFRRAFQKVAGRDPTYQAASAMDAFYHLDSALAAGQYTDGATLRQFIASSVRPTFWGFSGFTDMGMNEYRSMVLRSHRSDGKLDIISPLSSATVGLTYPIPQWGSVDRNYPCKPGHHVSGSNAWRADGFALTATEADSLDLFEDTVCEVCTRGTISTVTGSRECTPCPAGTAQSGEGRQECDNCNEKDGFFYQDEPGSAVCKACPQNTIKRGGTTGMKKEECICARGFWRLEYDGATELTGKTGEACVRYVEGADTVFFLAVLMYLLYTVATLTNRFKPTPRRLIGTLVLFYVVEFLCLAYISGGTNYNAEADSSYAAKIHYEGGVATVVLFFITILAVYILLKRQTISYFIVDHDNKVSAKIKQQLHQGGDLIPVEVKSHEGNTIAVSNVLSRVERVLFVMTKQSIQDLDGVVMTVHNAYEAQIPVIVLQVNEEGSDLLWEELKGALKMMLMTMPRVKMSKTGWEKELRDQLLTPTVLTDSTNQMRNRESISRMGRLQKSMLRHIRYITPVACATDVVVLAWVLSVAASAVAVPKFNEYVAQDLVSSSVLSSLTAVSAFLANLTFTLHVLWTSKKQRLDITLLYGGAVLNIGMAVMFGVCTWIAAKEMNEAWARWTGRGRGRFTMVAYAQASVAHLVTSLVWLVPAARGAFFYGKRMALSNQGPRMPKDLEAGTLTSMSQQRTKRESIFQSSMRRASHEVRPVSMKKDHDIFISYKRKDKHIAINIFDSLMSSGYKCWIDTMIEPGEYWRQQLANSLEDSKIILFLATPDSIASRYCQEEILYAKDLGKTIQPISLGSQAELFEVLPRHKLMQAIIAPIQIINFSENYEEGLAVLYMRLEKVIEKNVQQHIATVNEEPHA